MFVKVLKYIGNFRPYRKRRFTSLKVCNSVEGTFLDSSMNIIFSITLFSKAVVKFINVKLCLDYINNQIIYC